MYIAMYARYYSFNATKESMVMFIYRLHQTGHEMRLILSQIQFYFVPNDVVDPVPSLYFSYHWEQQGKSLI